MSEVLRFIDFITESIFGDRIDRNVRRIGCLAALLIILICACLFLIWVFGGCTPKEAPEELPTQPPAPGETQEPIATDEPEVEPVPSFSPLEILDLLNDAWCCMMCMASGDTLPAHMDISGLTINPPQLGDDPCFFTVVIEFSRGEMLDQPVLGGLIFDDPNGHIPSYDPNWCFGNAGNRSLGFAFLPPDTFETNIGLVDDTNEWTALPPGDYTGNVVQNQIQLQIPCHQMPRNPFMVYTSTIEQFPCDQLGQGDDGFPTLELDPAWDPLWGTPGQELPGGSSAQDDLGDVFDCETSDPIDDPLGDIDRIFYDFTEIGGDSFFQVGVQMQQPGDLGFDQAWFIDFYGPTDMSFLYSHYDGHTQYGWLDPNTGDFMPTDTMASFDPLTGLLEIDIPTSILPLDPFDMVGIDSLRQPTQSNLLGCDSLSDVIFADGFESGDVSAWSSHVP
ncbi:MAG: hypothetical protein PVF70_10565 [Anaerolineales bacterium]|jgi:hypothetical protein